MKKLDITGHRFGRLVAIELVSKNSSRGKMWKCKCDCGNDAYASAGALRSGNPLSCGCLQREAAAASCIKRSTTHGKTRTRIYTIWRGILMRCDQPSFAGWRHYGARGISMCDEWRYFEKFYEWAMSSGYAEHLTIDRNDVNGNYEPTNCSWKTYREQANNKRSNFRIEALGKNLTAAQWALESGIKAATIIHRIRSGWNADIAVTKLPWSK